MEDARRGSEVSGQPLFKLSFSADTSIDKSSALRVYEKEQCYTRPALGRDAISLLYIRYQVGNEHDGSFLNQASSGSAVHRLQYKSPDVSRRFSQAPICPRG